MKRWLLDVTPAFFHSVYFYWRLRREFSDLQGAIAFYTGWRKTQTYLGQEFSLRAMAYHCGRVLEGWRYDHDQNNFSTYYLDCDNAIIIYNS